MRFSLLLGAVLACLLTLAASAVAAPAPGDFDFSFGNRGYVGGDTYAAAAEGATAVGPKGEAFVLEPRQVALGSGVELTLARFAADGERDTAFGEAAVLAQQPVPGARDALAVDSQGRPLVAELNRKEETVTEGTQTKPAVRLELIVARFGRNGHLDQSFGEGGQVRTAIESPVGTAPVLAVEPDDSVLVAAEANSETLQNAVVATHLEADGSLDKSFGTNGLLAFKPGGASRPTALALTAGAGFELGLSQCCNGEYAAGTMPGVARFLAPGGADPSLAGTGEATVPRGAPSVVESIAPGPRGSVLAAIEEEGRGSSVIRVLPSGGLDPTFGKGGQALLGPEMGVGGVMAIANDEAGRIVGVAGRGAGGVKVFRLRNLGQPDGSFGGGRGVPLYPFAPDARTSGFGIQPDGKIVVGEEWGSSIRTFVLARLNGGNATARCFGKPATIVGTRERDIIKGTPGDDVIAALGGNDKVQGLGGDDLICGGPGNDKLYGGAGKNRLHQ